MNSLPIKGVMLVTTPQQLAALVVRKAANMLQRLDIPILGIIENMSYFQCPESGTRHEIFGASHALEIAEHCGAPLTARIPIDPQVSELCDLGRVEETNLVEVEQLVSQLSLVGTRT